jgi:DNA-binding HxlR family transcriptional regulator
MAKQQRRSDCPINYAVELFGDRWSFLILRDLAFKGKRYYVEFLHGGEGIATNILADRLATMEKEGIVIKQVDPAHGSKFIYRLSKKGIDLVPLLVEFILWSAKYDKQTAADMKFVSRAKRNKEGLVKEISDRLKLELNA